MLLALPLMVLAAWAHHRGFSSPSLQFLEHRAHRTIQGGVRLRGLAVALVFSVRRPAAGIGLLLPVVALIFVWFVGFAYTPVTAYFLLALTVIGHTLPTGERRLRWILIGAALAQLALAFAWPQTATESAQWLHTTFS